MVQITNSYAGEIMEWIVLPLTIKPSFDMLRLFFCYKLDWDSSIVSTDKTVTKKTEDLIPFLRLHFVSRNVPSDMAWYTVAMP